MIFSILILAVSVNAEAASLPSTLIHKVDYCTPVKSGKMIYFVKQWHLAPTVDTTNIELSKKLPQAKNQSEIYLAISELMTKKAIDTAVAEGCEGEIDSNFKAAFNGWSFDRLSKEVESKNYADILTSALLKAEAKFPAKLKTLCGDDLAQIKAAQMALSDLRGDMGYWQRIAENEKNPTKLKIYLDGLNEALKLLSTTNAATALLALKKDVMASFKTFNDANLTRNAALVKTIKKADSNLPILVVYGGLHTEDLKSKFQAEKWNCEIYEPNSYENNEGKLLDDFKKITE